MASAVVTRRRGHVLPAAPSLTPGQVKLLLMRTASKSVPTSSVVADDQGNTYTSCYDVFTIGAGYLDLQAAIAGAASVPSSGNSLSPGSSYGPSTGAVSLAFDAQSVWIDPGDFVEQNPSSEASVRTGQCIVARIQHH